MNVPGPSAGTEAALEATAEYQPFPEPVVLGDRYRLHEVIGRGGMAEVYRSDDLRLARPVAVKMLLGGAGDDSDRARFIAEAKTLAMLSHSNLVTVLDAGFGSSSRPSAVAGREHDRPFLVMELVNGPTWGQLMKRGPMALDELAPIAAQVAEALAYVHAQGVIHRDVKPGNVLIGHDNVVRLADFGIARLAEQRTHHTRSGALVGTAAYIAPEQVTGGELSGAVDVYALGLVLVEAITGRKEYDGTPAEAALARLHRPPEIPPVEPGWRDLLVAMTALDPADRPSAGEVAARLRGHPGEPVPVRTAVLPAARPSSPLTGRVLGLPSELVGAGAALAALLLLLVVLAVARGGDSTPSIPDNTPADLRGPLTELHVAVNGED